jgi:hypothetical protein
VTKTLLFVDFVPIPATFFMSGEDTGLLKMRDYAHGCALGDANTVGHIPHPRTRILGQAD